MSSSAAAWRKVKKSTGLRYWTWGGVVCGVDAKTAGGGWPAARMAKRAGAQKLPVGGKKNGVLEDFS